MKLKELIYKLNKKKKNTVYKIMKKLYNFMYRRVTFIPEKNIWVSTVVFPTNLIFFDGEDKVNICGITDVFEGDTNHVDFMPLHTVYIKKPSDSGDIHKDMVKAVKSGYNMKGVQIL